MNLGAFSVSLNVKDITASRDFYQTLGFEPIAGDIAQNWVILRNGHCVIGLFQGMIEGNTLTFNPGWAQDTSELAEFDDVRDIAAALKTAGIALTKDADPEGTGPEHITLRDPDGNAILMDQHRARN